MSGSAAYLIPTVQALRNQPLTVYGDGSQTRSFCYVSDMIRGLLAMMDQPDFIGPVNLGNPEEYSIQEIAEKIIHMTQSSSKISFLPLPEDDPIQRCPDNSLAAQKLGWTPTVGLEQGLGETIAYFRQKLSR